MAAGPPLIPQNLHIKPDYRESAVAALRDVEFQAVRFRQEGRESPVMMMVTIIGILALLYCLMR